MTALRIRYQTIEFDTADIHICTLRDKQQYHDPEGIAENLGISSALWPIFGVVWPCGLALATLMDNYDTNGKRILEVGCGIALPSLLLNSKGVDITATDYHPEVEYFLARNAKLNNGKLIAYEKVDWNHSSDGLGTFDMIIGSDLLYEDQHIDLLANFIDSHAKANCEVILVDPGRGRKSKLCSRMTEFGYASFPLKSSLGSSSKADFKGHILKFERQI